MQHRVATRPRFGIVLMVLGLCVGTCWDDQVGRLLIRCGEAPFRNAITRAYRERVLMVLGLSLVGVVVQAIWGHPASYIIMGEAVQHLVFCLAYQWWRIYGIRFI